MLVHKELLKDLKHLKENGPSDESDGICAHVLDEAEYLLQQMFCCWSKYSGSPSYPVPSDHPDYGAYSAYVDLHYLDKWNRDTQYGRDRWELLDFLIEFLEDCSVYVVTSVGVYPHEEFDHSLTADFRWVLVKNSLVPDTGVDDILEPVWASGESNHPCVVFVWS